MRDCTSADVQKGEQNKRLSEKSSHRPTVDCQRCFQVGALVLRADKLALLRSAQPLRLPHAVGWRVGGGVGLGWGFWLHQDPLGEALWLPHDNETCLPNGAMQKCPTFLLKVGEGGKEGVDRSV